MTPCSTATVRRGPGPCSPTVWHVLILRAASIPNTCCRARLTSAASMSTIRRTPARFGSAATTAHRLSRSNRSTRVCSDLRGSHSKPYKHLLDYSLIAIESAYYEAGIFCGSAAVCRRHFVRADAYSWPGYADKAAIIQRRRSHDPSDASSDERGARHIARARNPVPAAYRALQ